MGQNIPNKGVAGAVCTDFGATCAIIERIARMKTDQERMGPFRSRVSFLWLLFHCGRLGRVNNHGGCGLDLGSYRVFGLDMQIC
jgi:hypothetical protein